MARNLGIVDPDAESCPDALAWAMLGYARMNLAGFWERVFPKIMPKQDSEEKAGAFTDDGRELVKIEECLRSGFDHLTRTAEDEEA
ncbi:MAG: hypothetical protein IID40_08100 [Planctomycetes bacterium]|nr:hypothetical protein [Planctomycetota bacterium]